jgi:hypothetical protein
MRLKIALLAAAAALATAGAANAASVEFRDAVARVTVIPEDRADVKVEIIKANPRLPLQVRSEGSRVVIDGDLRRQIRDCHHREDRPSVYVRGVGDFRAEDMPQVVVHTPKSVEISANGAVFGSIGRSAALELHDSGCSAWTVADVAGEARLHESGAGAIHMGQADRLSVHLSGAANIRAVRVRQMLDGQLSGAGNIEVGDVAGTVDAQVSGIGHVKLGGGHVSQLRAQVSGMGGVDFDGVADNLDAGISGVGSVRVKKVNGNVNKHVSGLGHVTIG